MKRHYVLSAVLLVLLVTVSVPTRAGLLDDMVKSLGSAETPGAGLDNGTIAKGLKEALATGTGRAVGAVSRQDGYFGNQAIKILVPEKLRSTADLLRKFGYRQEVDDVVLGMNRAAEKAAPKATEYFIAALKSMSFEDARKILQGGDTSATEYFRQKTGADIHRAFKPVVSSSLEQVGAVKSYRLMMDKFNSIPFAGSMVTFDLDDYVVSKAVDGLFTMLGEEERKIRTDPAARGTELLRKVFGN